MELGKVEKYKFTAQGNDLSFQEVIDLLITSSDFRKLLTDVLINCPFKGFFWEVKPVTKQSLTNIFEFVLVNSSILPNISADKSAFQSYFEPAKKVVTFPNLRGDAQLIVPVNIGEDSIYAHMADFVRYAPFDQVDALWQLMAEEYVKLIGSAPKWLSTAGLGVSWLHIRVDSTPKYYRFQPYKFSET